VRNAYEIIVHGLKIRVHLGWGLSIDEKKMLKWILGKQDVRVWTAFIRPNTNEFSVPIKDGEFLD
jgi:hypothetical protein